MSWQCGKLTVFAHICIVTVVGALLHDWLLCKVPCNNLLWHCHCQRPSPTGFDGCSTRQLKWSVELGSLIAAYPNCFTPSYIDWTFNNVSSINSESQFTGVCRIRLLSTCWTAACVHRTSQAANALDRPTVTSWWFHDTVAARFVVGLSPSPVRWNGTLFHTHSGTLLVVTKASDRLWKLIFSQRNRDD